MEDLQHLSPTEEKTKMEALIKLVSGYEKKVKEFMTESGEEGVSMRYPGRYLFQLPRRHLSLRLFYET